MSDAIIGTGVLIQAGDGGSPETYRTVAEIVTLTPPAFSRNEQDVSTHNVGVEEKLLGMLRQGQVSATVNWVPTDPTHSSDTDGLLDDILANRKRNWRILYPPNGLPRWTFPARVQLFEPPEITVDTPMQMSVAWTIDGTITMENS